jgi:hypothetical protein
MQVELHPHPISHSDAVSDVYVDLQRSAEFIDLWFVIHGDLSKIVLPDPSSPRRANNLWQNTCFELFVRGEGLAYHEYNFSPSSEWSAYGFDGYRAGMRDIPVTCEPTISVSQTPLGALETHVTLSLPLGIEASRVGLSAVIEEKDGVKSYWALAHPMGPPDFHHDACFAAILPAIGSE